MESSKYKATEVIQIGHITINPGIDLVNTMRRLYAERCEFERLYRAEVEIRDIMHARIEKLKSASSKHQSPDWICNSDHPALAAVMRNAPAVVEQADALSDERTEFEDFLKEDPDAEEAGNLNRDGETYKNIISRFQWLSWKARAIIAATRPLAPVQAAPVRYVPVDSRLRDKHYNHPNDDEPRTQACIDALNARGDNAGQGLDGYWKWGFATGFNAALAAAPAPGAVA